jgi:hypothetical protein
LYRKSLQPSRHQHVGHAAKPLQARCSDALDVGLATIVKMNSLVPRVHFSNALTARLQQRPSFKHELIN